MVANQIECYRFEQRSVIKYFVVEKYKPYEIYSRMYNVVKKLFMNWLNIGLLQWDWVKKTVHGVETHWLSSIEKIPGLLVSKEGHADNLLETWKGPSL